MMAKGLNKAERHVIKVNTRQMPHLGALQAKGLHSDIRRVVMAELRKRGYRYDDRLDCWHKRAAYRQRGYENP